MQQPTAEYLLARDFATLTDLIRAHAMERGEKVAIADPDSMIEIARPVPPPPPCDWK